MSRLDCADETAFGERSDGEHSPTPSANAQTKRLRSTRSVARKLVIFAIEYFIVVKFASFDLCFCFSRSSG